MNNNNKNIWNQNTVKQSPETHRQVTSVGSYIQKSKNKMGLGCGMENNDLSGTETAGVALPVTAFDTVSL